MTAPTATLIVPPDGILTRERPIFQPPLGAQEFFVGSGAAAINNATGTDVIPHVIFGKITLNEDDEGVVDSALWISQTDVVFPGGSIAEMFYDVQCTRAVPLTKRYRAVPGLVFPEGFPVGSSLQLQVGCFVEIPKGGYIGIGLAGGNATVRFAAAYMHGWTWNALPR